MATAKIERQTTITLALSENEARYVMGMLQNPLCNPEEEPADDAQTRYAVFDALHDALSEHPTKK